VSRIQLSVPGILAICALALQAGVASAAELKVFSSLAFTNAWRDLKPKFEARGHKLEVILATSGVITKRVTGGEVGDVILNTDSSIDGLIKDGRVLAGTSKRVAGCGVGISVRKGAPKPDISTPEALKRTLLSARAVAYSDPAGGGASGIHFSKVLERLGIAEQIKPKAKLGQGVPNGEAVARGEADLAVQQIPELLPVAGTELVGPLPRELQAITTFSAASLAPSKSPKAVTALIEFLTSPEAAAVLKAAGFEVSASNATSRY
jgi:molybdate transport system substrate-binding protein